MLSVALPLAEAQARLRRWDGRVSIAAVNGPGSVVVSGALEALDELFEELSGADMRVRRIAVDYASHSAQVERVRDELTAALEGIRPRRAEVPFFSTVTGDWLDTTGMDAGYWYRNLRRTVGFEPASPTATPPPTCPPTPGWNGSCTPGPPRRPPSRPCSCVRTLLLRASDPFPVPDGTDPVPPDWQTVLPHVVTTLTTPGDHFTLVNQHASATAGHIIDWLTGRGTGCAARSTTGSTSYSPRCGR